MGTRYEVNHKTITLFPRSTAINGQIPTRPQSSSIAIVNHKSHFLSFFNQTHPLSHHVIIAFSQPPVTESQPHADRKTVPSAKSSPPTPIMRIVRPPPFMVQCDATQHARLVTKIRASQRPGIGFNNNHNHVRRRLTSQDP